MEDTCPPSVLNESNQIGSLDKNKKRGEADRSEHGSMLIDGVPPLPRLQRCYMCVLFQIYVINYSFLKYT